MNIKNKRAATAASVVMEDMTVFDEDETGADAVGSLGGLDDGRLPRRQKRGDGRPFEPFRWRQVVAGRKLFALSVPRPGAQDAIYAVDVRTSAADDDGLFLCPARTSGMESESGVASRRDR